MLIYCLNATIFINNILMKWKNLEENSTKKNIKLNEKK